MKTVLSFFFMALFCLGTGSVFAQITGPTRYIVYTYVKVLPGKNDDYMKLSKATKKINLELKKAGKVDDWSLSEVLSPSGSSTQYNFISRSAFIGEAQYASSYEDNYWPANWQSFLTIDELNLFFKREEIRTVIKRETWELLDNVMSDDTTTRGKIVVCNYFSIPEGKTNADHTKVERDIWKPVHQARVKAGTMKGWLLMDMRLPFGTAYPYSSATIDVYTDMKQYLMQNGMEDTFKKVHPGKDMNALWKQTIEAAKINRGEVREIVDRLSWK